MSFLTPWALSLLALAAVPLALHLFHRDSDRRIPFPAIRYLQTARRRSARALRLRDRLLMWVRVTLLSALAATAAAPLVGRGGPADHWPTDAVIILDNSASTRQIVDGSTIFSRQVARAVAALSEAGEADRFWVLPALGGVRSNEAPAAGARASVERIEETDGPSDLGALVREASLLLPAETGRHREILLLFDLQGTALPDSLSPLPEGVDLVISAIRSERPNGAIIAGRAEPPAPGGASSVSAALAAYPAREVDDTVEVRLAIDDRTVSIRRAPAEGTVEFLIPALPPGEHVASLEVPPSGLRADDRFAMVLRVADPPAVRHAGETGGYVTRGLEALRRAGRISQPDSSAAGVVREGVTEAGEPEGHLAPLLVVLVPPADRTRLARFNADLTRYGLPWRLQPDTAAGELTLIPTSLVPGLDRVRVLRRYSLRGAGAPADTVLLRTDDGAPWLARARSGETVYLLLASPVDPAATSLPIDAAFVPFLEQLLLGWSGLGGLAPPTLLAGQHIPLPSDADSVGGPDGRVTRVDGDSPYLTTRAGVYTVFAGAGRRSVAVAVPPAESDVRPMEAHAAARRLGRPRATIATTDAQWLNAVFGARRGASAVPVVLALVVALAVAEVILATSGSSASDRAGAST